jgi:hypothetical protein
MWGYPIEVTMVGHHVFYANIPHFPWALGKYRLCDNMFHRRKIFLTKTESGRLPHQYGITHPGTQIISLSIVIIAMDLVIKK